MNTPTKAVRALLALSLLTLCGSTYAKGGYIELDRNNFGPDSNMITNHWWPLPQGARFIYFEEEECVLGVVDVMPAGTFRTEVNGVAVREVLDREYIDEEGECDGNVTNPEDEAWQLVEITYDWYAQDLGGNVWYFGEHTVATELDDDCEHVAADTLPPFYTAGCLDGSWEAGYDIWEEETDEEILPGIIMLANPEKGMFYFQEYWEDEATDMGKILNFKTVDTLLFDELDGCLMIKEWVPLEPGEVEHKYYCEGVGLVLVEGNAGGPTIYEELVLAQ